MMYENRLATIARPGNFIGAGAIGKPSRLVHREDGPVGIQDTAEGLHYQVWTSRVIGNDVQLSAPNQATSTLLTGTDITDFSFAFDQNANIYYAWTDGGVTRLRWWDGSIMSYVVTDYGATMRTPKLTLDDKWASQEGASDVIFAYIKIEDDGLYFRQQRDRFSVEYYLGGPFLSLERMYFNNRNALQFAVMPGRPNV